MPNQIQQRRGTTAEHASFTGAVAEITVDTTKDTVVVHDGTTAGGHPLSKEGHTHTEFTAASQAEMEAGTEAAIRAVSPLRVSQAIAVLSGANLQYAARTSNTELGLANKGYYIEITSGTFTQTLAAAATLGSGWFCYLKNSGTGDITLDPSGSETIDGLTSFIMYPGEARLIQCTGTAFHSIVLNAFYRTFTASTTFTKPPGYTLFSGMLWGAGANGTEWYGGGGGACVLFNIPSSTVSASQSITIATGAGANSTFSTATAQGGYENVGGGYDGALPGSRVGDNPVIPATRTTMGGGYGAGSASSSVSTNGGSSVYGGGGGAGADVANGGSYLGGSSIFGGAGGNSNANGTAPGGGGGMGTGLGARGELRIWGII